MGQKTALVTGASSGIGEALAAQFAAAGFDLILVARREAKLKGLASELEAGHGVKARAEAADLSLSGAATALAKKLRQAKLEPTVLVNNAGVLEHGPFIDIPASRHQEIIDLNISGLTAMLSAFVPNMVTRGEGRVLNVASAGAFQPIPSLGTYAATKAYVLSLTEALSEELRGTGVTVSALCPGFTDTNMVSSARAKSGQLDIPDFMMSDVDDVAREGFQACMQGEVVRVPGRIYQAMTLTSRSAPKWLVRRFWGIAGRYSTR